MFKSIFAMLMFCLVVGSVVAQDNGVNSRGRYQLHSAVAEKTGSGPLIRIFLLDTETGRVWTTSSYNDYVRWRLLPSHEPLPPFPEVVTD